jgi:hypothetical protein
MLASIAAFTTTAAKCRIQYDFIADADTMYT